MAEVDLLRALPKSTRDIARRAAGKTPEVVRVAREFGAAYFDGPREYGYGGYRYDGRWQPVARDIVEHFALKPGDRVLDIGCAKGFLVKDLLQACPGLEVFGLDVSRYALMNCEAAAVGRLHLGSAEDLLFPDGGFAAVLAINVLHNLTPDRCVTALREIQRVSSGRAFVQVDAYRSEEEKRLFLDWVLTADTHGYPREWLDRFTEAGYTGDWYWTIA